jgi:hypothetical protein
LVGGSQAAQTLAGGSQTDQTLTGGSQTDQTLSKLAKRYSAPLAPTNQRLDRVSWGKQRLALCERERSRETKHGLGSLAAAKPNAI